MKSSSGRCKCQFLFRQSRETSQTGYGFFRTQWMESLGTLVGGIAHDLNKVLSPIAMGVQMLQLKHTDEFSRSLCASGGKGIGLNV